MLRNINVFVKLSSFCTSGLAFRLFLLEMFITRRRELDLLECHVLAHFNAPGSLLFMVVRMVIRVGERNSAYYSNLAIICSAVTCVGGRGVFLRIVWDVHGRRGNSEKR